MPDSLVDTSVWVAAAFQHHPAHRLAEDELIAAARRGQIYFCRATQQSFLRLITTPSLLRQYQAEGFTNREAACEYTLLRAKLAVAEIAEPSGICTLWHRLAARDIAAPKVWMDAYLAAFAIVGGLEFVTLDRDFKTYEEHGLRLRLLVASTNS